MNPSRRSFIIGIGGPSCTGKSTVAKQVARKLGAQVISMESYYLDLGHLAPAERPKRNFDHPEALDATLLAQHVRDFALGKDIQVPMYDFAEHTRISGRHELVHSAPVLIVEGILVLHWPEVRDQFDLSVYFDAPDDVCFQRRKVRDIVERQRSSEFIKQQYDATVRPMAQQFIYPTKAYADVVLDATKPVAQLAAELSAKVAAVTAAGR